MLNGKKMIIKRMIYECRCLERFYKPHRNDRGFREGWLYFEILFPCPEVGVRRNWPCDICRPINNSSNCDN